MPHRSARADAPHANVTLLHLRQEKAAPTRNAGHWRSIGSPGVGDPEPDRALPSRSRKSASGATPRVTPAAGPPKADDHGTDHTEQKSHFALRLIEGERASVGPAHSCSARLFL